jgi:hypothetical protein
MKELRAVPKPVRIQSKPLTDSARGKACTLRWECDGTDAVFCHVRINSGVATKPPDFFGFYGCGACNKAEDAARVPAFAILRAILETQYQMAVDGLLVVKGWKP